jgi:hypothetical protein
MNWPSPVPLSVDDNTGTTWQVRRAWPDKTPGDYVLEVLTPGRPGVRGAHLRHGQFELIPPDDPGLPALRAEAQQGEVISYRPHRRAVIRVEGRYIKIFRPGQGLAAAERCAQMDMLLDAWIFTTPRILRSSQEVIVFSTILGKTLYELGADDSPAGDGSFAWAWETWSHLWVAQLSTPECTGERGVLNSLPLHSAEVEAAAVWRCVNRWLSHNESVPELSPQRNVMRAKAEEATNKLLRTAADPLVWAHGDLHGKQIIILEDRSGLGLLDFDGAARAEAALDLAKLDVRLELHLRRNLMAPERYLLAHTKVLTTAEELHVNPCRFDAYADAIWLRLACSPLAGRPSLAITALEDRASRQALPSVTTTRMVYRPSADVDARPAGRAGCALAQDQGTETASPPRQATAGDFPKPGMTPPRRFRYSFSPLFLFEMPTEWSDLWMCVLRIFPDFPLF